ncbi:MAG: hypothetical protein K9G45_12965, partial [Bacteroidales bacterium]|nr:hypothetical protein [Bacteroidales bacterium]
ACNKDDDENNEPENVKSYTGITDQDYVVQFQTGEINSTLYLLKYDLTVLYSSQQGANTQELELYKSEGITKIENNQFEVNLSVESSFLKGNFSQQMDSLTGQYSYKFSQADTVISGQFWTLKTP